MAPERIPAGAYTHLNFAFAFIDPSTYKVSLMSASDKELYSRFTALKDANPGLETWIAVGGWSMNDPDQPTKTTFSDLAASPSAQSSFFKSLISFMQSYGFDGVDIDWEYPVAEERSGRPEDFKNIVSFLANLKAALGATGHNYGLTITLPASYWYLQHFDIVKLEKVVDWFNVMTYDLHGTWDSTNKFIGPFVNAHTNLTEIDLTMDLFWRNRIDPDKLVLGLGFYGRSFTLEDPACSKPGCRFSSGGNPGRCSATAGILLSSEIKELIKGGAKPTMHKDAAVKQIVWDNNQWVSYDDSETFKLKIDYANKRCLGGTMVWAVSGDDKEWSSTIDLTDNLGLQEKSLWGGGSTPKMEPLSACVWGDCGRPCPPGLSPAQRSDKGGPGPATIYSGCPRDEPRNYCCPTNNMPTCTWRGRAPLCTDGKCKAGEVEVSSDIRGTGKKCNFNHKVLCCTRTDSDQALGLCKWEGSAPGCGSKSDGCSSKTATVVTTSRKGGGGEQSCNAFSVKRLCCEDTDPDVFAGCEWYRGPSFIPLRCGTTCPKGKQIIASDDTFCTSGSSLFCCPTIDSKKPDAEDLALNMCMAEDADYILSTELDPEYVTPNDLSELTIYEEECWEIPTIPSSNLQTRWNSLLGQLWKRTLLDKRAAGDDIPSGNVTRYSVCLPDSDCHPIPAQDEWWIRQVLDQASVFEPSLEPRASRRPRICDKNKKELNRIRAQSYHGVKTLSQNGRLFFSRATATIQAGICAALPIVLGARNALIEYVTEHMTELRTPAQFGTSMLQNQFPDGTTPVDGGYDWKKVFDKGGYFQMTWAQLGGTAPANWRGNTPEETIMNALGSKGKNGDSTNLLICDAKINSLKTAVWALFDNIIGDDKWAALDHEARIEQLNMLRQTLIEYFNSKDAQKALKHGYDVQQAVWAAVDAASNTNTPSGTNFVSLHNIWYSKFFHRMQGNLLVFLQDKYKEELVWAASKAAIKKYGKPAAQQLLKVLKSQESSLTKDVVIKVSSWLV